MLLPLLQELGGRAQVAGAQWRQPEDLVLLAVGVRLDPAVIGRMAVLPDRRRRPAVDAQDLEPASARFAHGASCNTNSRSLRASFE
jgi:hypothetical protein